MMPIALHIAEKLLRLAGGEQLPASQLKYGIITELINDDVIQRRIVGRTQSVLCVPDANVLDLWLFQRYGINNLVTYIEVLKDTAADKSDLIAVANNSKSKATRSYKGFLVNSYEPVECTLNGLPYSIHPAKGTFQFIYDFERFVPGNDVTIIGIENMLNFSRVAQQRHLFGGLKALFICRYPQEQSGDIMKWLKSLPNKYLHFGDCDFAGVNIYLNEYRKHLGDRASFYIPPNFEMLLANFGNTKLYDRQTLSKTEIEEENVKDMVALLHQYKKGVEQEALLIAL